MLPSNVDLADFPDNTNSTYTVKLDRPLRLQSGRWEVGLADILFPKTWDNVTEGIITFRRSRPLQRDYQRFVVKVRKGLYETITELILMRQRALTTAGLLERILLYYDTLSNRSMINILKKEYQMLLSDDIAQILGFKAGEWVGAGKH